MKFRSQFVSQYLSSIVFGSIVSVGLVGTSTAVAQPAPAEPPPAEPATDTPPPPAPPPAAPAEPAAADKVIITGTVRSPDLESPLSGAKISVDNTSISTLTDEQGRFTLSAPPGQITLRADVNGFRPATRQLSVSAGKSADVDFPLSLDQLLTEVVVIVGSRTPRTNVETTAPVDVVTAEEISKVGKTETGRVLSTLAPSYISTPQTVADGTDHVDPASLRGLGPDQVLVLINGKRRHKSALINVNGTFGRGTVGTDLNAIPVGSIKRIEILRDGAASQYGSDAIAGVINVVTKDYTDLLDITTLTGVTGAGDGAQIKTSANYGFKIGKKGFLNLTGEFLKKEATNRSGAFTGAIFNADKTMDDAILASKGLTRDDYKMKIGEAAAEDALGSYNLELPIDDTSTFYSFGDLSRRNGNAAGFTRYPVQETQVVTDPGFYPDGFLPEIHSNINDLGVTIGVRRKGDWTVDASLTHGRNSFQFNIENTVNASFGTNSLTSFDAGTLSSSETVGDIDVLRKLNFPGVKAMNFVVGTEVRTENYKITAGDPGSYESGGATTAAGIPKQAGAQVFPGFQPSNEVDRNRSNIGLYTGLETEVIKGLNIDIGGRYENYSDFGNSLIGKAAIRVPIGRAIALRAAASTGFRAPSLQQLWFNNISTQFVPVNGVQTAQQVLTSNNASPVTKAFGIPQLNEEKSTNLSGGLALRPFDNFALTADGYFVRLKNRIVMTGQFIGLGPGGNAAVADILTPFVGVQRAQFFANAVDTDTMGADVVADYAVDTGAGTLGLSAAANFTKTEVKDVHIPQLLVDRFTAKGVPESSLRTAFFGRLAQNRLEDTVPHQKGNLAVRYTLKQLSALVRGNYYGRVRYKSDPVVNAMTGDITFDDENFRAKVLFDVDLSFSFTKNLQLTVGADNVFDTYPDRNTKATNISSGRFVYNRNVSQIGMNGGFYYGKLSLTFF